MASKVSVKASDNPSTALTTSTARPALPYSSLACGNVTGLLNSVTTKYGSCAAGPQNQGPLAAQLIGADDATAKASAQVILMLASQPAVQSHLVQMLQNNQERPSHTGNSSQPLTALEAIARALNQPRKHMQGQQATSKQQQQNYHIPRIGLPTRNNMSPNLAADSAGTHAMPMLQFSGRPLFDLQNRSSGLDESSQPNTGPLARQQQQLPTSKQHAQSACSVEDEQAAPKSRMPYCSSKAVAEDWANGKSETPEQTLIRLHQAGLKHAVFTMLLKAGPQGMNATEISAGLKGTMWGASSCGSVQRACRLNPAVIRVGPGIYAARVLTEGKSKAGFACQLHMGRNPGAKAAAMAAVAAGLLETPQQTLARLQVGTITRAVFELLLDAGPQGMTIIDIMKAFHERGLWHWRDTHSAKSSLYSTCGLEPAIVKVATGTYAVRALIQNKGGTPATAGNIRPSGKHQVLPIPISVLKPTPRVEQLQKSQSVTAQANSTPLHQQAPGADVTAVSWQDRQARVQEQRSQNTHAECMDLTAFDNDVPSAAQPSPPTEPLQVLHSTSVEITSSSSNVTTKRLLESKRRRSLSDGDRCDPIKRSRVKTAPDQQSLQGPCNNEVDALCVARQGDATTFPEPSSGHHQQPSPMDATEVELSAARSCPAVTNTKDCSHDNQTMAPCQVMHVDTDSEDRNVETRKAAVGNEADQPIEALHSKVHQSLCLASLHPAGGNIVMANSSPAGANDCAGLPRMHALPQPGACRQTVDATSLPGLHFHDNGRLSAKCRSALCYHVTKLVKGLGVQAEPTTIRQQVKVVVLGVATANRDSFANGYANLMDLIACMDTTELCTQKKQAMRLLSNLFNIELQPSNE